MASHSGGDDTFSTVERPDGVMVMDLVLTLRSKSSVEGIEDDEGKVGMDLVTLVVVEGVSLWTRVVIPVVFDVDGWTQLMV